MKQIQEIINVDKDDNWRFHLDQALSEFQAKYGCKPSIYCNTKFHEWFNKQDIKPYETPLNKYEGYEVLFDNTIKEGDFRLVGYRNNLLSGNKGVDNDISNHEYMLKLLKSNTTHNLEFCPIEPCKYLLPCGKCDKTDLLCNQYER